MNPYLKLTATLTNPKVVVADKLKAICTITSQLIAGADRVSLWSFSEDFQEIESLICYDTSTGAISSGMTMKKSDFKDYFKGILEQEVINVPEARTHDLTKLFNEKYLEPHNIQSLLDFVLHQDFVPAGIICCESVGKTTHWTDDNIESLRRIASSSSMYFRIG